LTQGWLRTYFAVSEITLAKLDRHFPRLSLNSFDTYVNCVGGLNFSLLMSFQSLMQEEVEKKEPGGGSMHLLVGLSLSNQSVDRYPP